MKPTYLVHDLLAVQVVEGISLKQPPYQDLRQQCGVLVPVFRDVDRGVQDDCLQHEEYA